MRRSIWIAFTAMMALGMALMGATVPRQARELVIETAKGPVLLSQYKGKVVVLEFLLTTCPHCKKCSMVMEKLGAEFKGKSVVMLGAAVNTPSDLMLKAYVDEQKLTYPLGKTDHRGALAFLQHPEVVRASYPQLVVIDQTGKIQRQYSGGDKFFEDEESHLRQDIKALLKIAPASKK